MNQGLSLNIAQVMTMAVATGLFTSLCSIQQPSGVFTASGAPDGNYVAIAALTNIPCMDAPDSEVKIQATEQREMAEIMATTFRHVLLNAYYQGTVVAGTDGITYTGIQPQWRAIVDGITYDILGAEADSQNTQTRLKLWTGRI